MADNQFIEALGLELTSLDGIHAQDIETGGKNIKGLLGNYTNKLFGAPYQFLESVDPRFKSINPNVGNEYLKNFLLHSPILHIKPGMPRYTGDDDPTTTFRQMQKIYADDDSMSLSKSLIRSLAEKTVFSAGSRLQRRMFGLRPTYTEYMMYVNYMCRSIAILMGLTGGNSGFPNGTFVSTHQSEDNKSDNIGFVPFESIRWENYRMVGNSFVASSLQHLKDLADATPIGAGIEGAKAAGAALNPLSDDFLDGSKAGDKITKAWNKAMNTDLSDVVQDRSIQSLMFMVEPVSFTENLTNNTDQSFIESSINAVSDSVGSEIAFITGSRADTGIIGGLTEFLGSNISSAAMNLGKMVQPATGGFMTNLFSGAIQSIKGQHMIYPDIYKSSNSTMDYEYSVTLTTPYGDIYNYYMNIVVPLMHLIALAAPRMVTSNTVSSPFLVQTYIPGMATCQLGIISNMSIVKNPDYKSVTVNGFPSTIKVTFQVKELYNAMSISPANDPASFMFNETLNDYMANMAGLIPSIDTFAKQRAAAFQNLEQYFESGEFASGLGDYLTDKISDTLFKRRA